MLPASTTLPPLFSRSMGQRFFCRKNGEYWTRRKGKKTSPIGDEKRSRKWDERGERKMPDFLGGFWV